MGEGIFDGKTGRKEQLFQSLMNFCKTNGLQKGRGKTHRKFYHANAIFFR